MWGDRLDPAERFGPLLIGKIRIEQDDIHRISPKDGRSVGACGRVGYFQMDPVAPVAGAVQFRQDFAQE